MQNANIDIIANFVFTYICSFLLYIQHMMLVNVKLDISGNFRITFQDHKNSFVQFFSNGKAKMKSTILAFWCCGEFVKNSSEHVLGSAKETWILCTIFQSDLWIGVVLVDAVPIWITHTTS